MSLAPPAAPPMRAPRWRIGGGRVMTIDRPIVVGIVNVTPDSFSDGGRFFRPADALAHAATLLEDGADVLDVGGESTRPQGAAEVSEEEERRRVIPVVRELGRRFPDAILSVDTVKAAVAEAALDEGVHIVNDVSGMRLDARMAATLARGDAGVVLMHSRGPVSEMGTTRHATYGPDVASEILAELLGAVDAARAADIADDRIVVDPGIGFAKRTEHSLAMLAALPRLAAWQYPVLVGVSRKRFVGELTGEQEPAARVAGTTGANVAALLLGARLFRVHDVKAARQALDVAWAILHGAATQRGAVEDDA